MTSMSKGVLRRNKLTEYLIQFPTAQNFVLIDIFGVSSRTIDRDLKILKSQQKIKVSNSKSTIGGHWVNVRRIKVVR